jgi:hypothetical protein
MPSEKPVGLAWSKATRSPGRAPAARGGGDRRPLSEVLDATETLRAHPGDAAAVLCGPREQARRTGRQDERRKTLRRQRGHPARSTLSGDPRQAHGVPPLGRDDDAPIDHGGLEAADRAHARSARQRELAAGTPSGELAVRPHATTAAPDGGTASATGPNWREPLERVDELHAVDGSQAGHDAPAGAARPVPTTSASMSPLMTAVMLRRTTPS